MSANKQTTSNSDIENLDRPVDVEIAKCLDLEAPQSFFLFAGAGSGKTYSLVEALKHVQKTSGERLRLKGQRVAVVTYTNAACDEIKRRIKFDPLIDVSTLHSFAWSLIDGLNRDIREWLRQSLAEDILDLQTKEGNKRAKPSKASVARQLSIISKTKRLEMLDSVGRFTYSPEGENKGRDSLNHAEVINMTAYFLTNKPVMQEILVGRYPFLLVDESQDTNKHLIDALFVVQKAHQSKFALGLIGDMMQRIYFDGKEDLGCNLPPDWAQPVKQINRRCPQRIVTLINKIRSATDQQQQIPLPRLEQGEVAFFIFPSNTLDKSACEKQIASKMAEITGDIEWQAEKGFQCLILEHKMAARRLGFIDVFAPLYDEDSFKTGLLNGKLSFVRLFTEQVMPLKNAQLNGDRFAVARIAKKFSPLLRRDVLAALPDQTEQLMLANQAIANLVALWQSNTAPTLLAVLRNIAASRLFAVPEMLVFFASVENSENVVAETADEERDSRQVAIEAFLNAPFSQIERYVEYITRQSHFDTHQGVKGLEFERVMVIMDDADAAGFSFSYEKLFDSTKVGDDAVKSVRRLFYVTCSRAEKSLALVAYSKNVESVKQFVLAQEWFDKSEIHCDLMI